MLTIQKTKKPTCWISIQELKTAISFGCRVAQFYSILITLDNSGRAEGLIS
jgi:hypothetical protein